MTATGRIYFCLLGRDKLNSVWKIFVFGPCISREKLYEELLMKEEGLQDTLNHLIHIGKPIEMDEKVFLEKLVHLKKEAYDETNDIRHLIKDIVPTYQPKS